MNVQEFMVAVESIYGAYSRPALRGLVAAKVAHLSDERREVLFGGLVDTYSTRYGTQPDVVAINDAMADVREVAFVDGRPAGHYDGNRFIPDMTGAQRDRLTDDERAESAAAATAMRERLQGPAA